MVVIVDIEVPADQFELGRLFESFRDLEIELERVIPVDGGAVIPLFWVSGGDPDEIEQVIRADPLTQDVNVLTRADARDLFEVSWSPDVDSLVQPLIRHDADVLRAVGNPDTWEFRIQFREKDDLSAFYEGCRSDGVRVEPLRIYNPSHPEQTTSLTDAQVEALRTSYEAGYWEVPRRTSLTSLGSTMGVSDTAVSQRIRRGVKTLIEQHVLSDLDTRY